MERVRLAIGLALWGTGYVLGLLHARRGPLEIERDPSWRQIFAAILRAWWRPLLLTVSGGLLLATKTARGWEAIVMATFFWFGFRDFFDDSNPSRLARAGRASLWVLLLGIGIGYGYLVWTDRL